MRAPSRRGRWRRKFATRAASTPTARKLVHLFLKEQRRKVDEVVAPHQRDMQPRRLDLRFRHPFCLEKGDRPAVGIDQAILALMAERQAYVAEAGRFKRDPAAVSDRARVEAIIVKTRALAAKNGLAEEVAERTFRAMIAAFEDYERKEWLARTK